MERVHQIGKAPVERLSKVRFEQKSIPEMAVVLDQLTADVLKVNPAIGSYDFLQKFSDRLPGGISSETQKRIVKGLTDADNNVRDISKKVFLLLASGTIMSVINRYFIEGIDKKQDREEMVQEIFSYLGDKISKGEDTEIPVARRTTHLAEIAVSEYLAREKDMPRSFTVNPTNRRTIMINAKRNNLTWRKRKGFINELTEQTGLGWQNLFEYFKYKNDLRVGYDRVDSIQQGSDSISELIETKAMRGALIDALQTLSNREKKVLSGRLEKGRTLDEVGLDSAVTGERARQIEARALRKMRKSLCKTYPEGWAKRAIS